MRIRYDSSPPSCGLLVEISNTSLRIKDECLIFTTAKICSNVNKLTSQKKHLPLTQTLKHRLNFTRHCEFFISVFSVSREGGWEFHPFLRAALPTLISLRSPTQTLGYLHGYSGSRTPGNIAKAVQCLLLCGDAKT